MKLTIILKYYVGMEEAIWVGSFMHSTEVLVSIQPALKSCPLGVILYCLVLSIHSSPIQQQLSVSPAYSTQLSNYCSIGGTHDSALAVPI